MRVGFGAIVKNKPSAPITPKATAADNESFTHIGDWEIICPNVSKVDWSGIMALATKNAWGQPAIDFHGGQSAFR
jgi:hypothetical protein